MFDYGPEHFDEVLSDPSVRAAVDGIEQARRKTMLLVLSLAFGGILAGFALHWLVKGAGWDFLEIGVPFLLGVGGFYLAMRAFEMAGEPVKRTLLGALARRGGLEYRLDGFDPPELPGAREALFGEGALAEARYRDMFSGVDEAGRPFAVYEARITVEHDDDDHAGAHFSGRIFAFARTSGVPGHAALRSPPTILSVIDAEPPGLTRTSFGEARADAALHVWSSDPAAVRNLGPGARALLVELAERTRLFASLDGERALVAIADVDRYEIGPIFRAAPGEARARRMFGDLCDSMALLRRLKSALG